MPLRRRGIRLDHCLKPRLATRSWLLDKLRAHIENCAFRYKDTPVPVTLSCGIAQFHARDTLEEVFERADRAMYVAKDKGRNQVCTEADLQP